MNHRDLDMAEVVAVIGGILLGVSLFLGWYHLGNQYAALQGCHGPNADCSGWHAMKYLKFPVLIAALAPLVLTWVIVAGHKFSWPRGELTAVVAICALVLVVFRGIIDKPGTPQGEISVSIGWFVALLGGLLIFAGAITRAHESTTRKKPPGVL
ncbi:MAG: hypothetical protein J2O48_05260 [Solirubrobacterales bacterium]|nr:hypothetical protein [Solirubrobacterales bacterium]